MSESVPYDETNLIELINWKKLFILPMMLMLIIPLKLI